MTNAKEEFLGLVEGKIVKCVSITHGDYYNDEDHSIKLKQGYSTEDYDNFKSAINFNYDSGYGGQEVYGTVWFQDGTWANRGEYDGSEWWEYQEVPEIPTELVN